MINLEDSFIQNEQMANQMSKKDQDRLIIARTFSDDRIPSSLQGRQPPTYQKDNFFDDELD